MSRKLKIERHFKIKPKRKSNTVMKNKKRKKHEVKIAENLRRSLEKSLIYYSVYSYCSYCTVTSTVIGFHFLYMWLFLLILLNFFSFFIPQVFWFYYKSVPPFILFHYFLSFLIPLFLIFVVCNIRYRIPLSVVFVIRLTKLLFSL